MSGFLFKIKIHRKNGQSLKAPVKSKNLILILHPFYVTSLFAVSMKNDKISRHQTIKNALMYRIVKIRDFNSFSFSGLPQHKLGQLIFLSFSIFPFISRYVYCRTIKFSRYITLNPYLINASDDTGKTQLK